jgi:hypothetical protein
MKLFSDNPKQYGGPLVRISLIVLSWYLARFALAIESVFVQQVVLFSLIFYFLLSNVDDLIAQQRNRVKAGR